MNPPSAGPATFPDPTTVMNDPIALPRSSLGNDASTIAIPVPCVMLAPTPCNTLNAMSVRMLSDVLANSPPTAKMTKPVT